MADSSVQALIERFTQKLSNLEQPRLEAEVMLSHVLDKPRSWLRTWPERVVSSEHITIVSDWVDRRIAGEPLAYLTGVKEFWSLELRVTPDTLIPRPETETLVESALALIPAGADSQVIDLGTGSGAIALAIASERRRANVVGIDYSAAAVAVASDNGARLGITNASFVVGDWLAGVAQRSADMIVANPPYVAEGDPHLLEDGLPFEPLTALVASDQGLADLRTNATQASSILKPGGWLLMEHGFDQHQAVKSVLEFLGYQQISAIADLAGQQRITQARIDPS